MKKSIFLIPLVLLGVFLFITYACEKEDDPVEMCESFDADCNAPELATICCDENDVCYYTYEGKKYECNGQDCTDAELALIEDMCGTNVSIDFQNIQLRLRNQTLLLLDEVRATFML